MGYGSPGTYYNAVAWYVSSSGRVDFSADFSRVDYSYGIYCDWWLKSPETGIGNVAQYMTSSGTGGNYVNGGVVSSYGRRSPNTDYDYVAWCVRPSGEIYNIAIYYVDDSYGSTLRSRFSLMEHGILNHVEY